MTRPAARRARCPIEPLERRAYLAATVTFAPAVAFTAGTAPVALATADFNDDGHADLVVADATAQTASVFFGTGTGTFTAGPVLTLPAPPTAILTGDFNGDGVPDIAVACSPGSTQAGTTVTVFLNNGTGTFGLGQQTTVETGVGTAEPVAIAAGDFNTDGHLDLVATDYSNGQVSVLLGQGNGTFAAPATYGVGSDPTAVAVGDFNGDGKLDIAATATLGTTDEVLLLAGGGTGQFTDSTTTPLTAAGSTTLTAADLTGDGKAIDLVVGNADGTVTLLVNPGSGAFATSADPSIGSAPTGVAVADLNVDGHADVVTADGGDATSAGVDDVTVIPGLGDGTIGPATQAAVGSLPQAVVTADFNGDGKPDVATADEGAGTVSVLLNTTAVTPLATKTTLAVSSATTPAGSAVTLTATVTPPAVSLLSGESAPTGTVDFYDGTTLLGTTALAAASGVSTATATLAVSSLTVGAHRLTAKYAADTAYAASASAAATETITATATSGPDLVATFATVGLPATVAPGETGTVKVTLTNQGNAAAAGTITDALYLSLDTALDAADTPVTVKGSLARAAVKLAVDKSVTLTGTFTVPAAVPLGTYELLVAADANAGVVESNSGNDVTASPTAYTVADQFGTVGGRKGVTLDVADATGTAATFRLTGPGTGTVAVGDDGVDVTLAGTTAASALTITPPAGATYDLHDLTDSASIGTVRAAAVDVTSAVTVGGTAGAVALGDVSGATVTPGSTVRSLSVAAFASGTLDVANLGTFADAGAFGAATSATSIKAVTIGGADTGTILTTGDVGTVLVKGDLTGTLGVGVGTTTTRLSSLRVLGSATGTTVTVGGSLGSLTVVGPVDATSRFLAATEPKRALLGGVAVDPATDPRFAG